MRPFVFIAAILLAFMAMTAFATTNTTDPIEYVPVTYIVPWANMTEDPGLDHFEALAVWFANNTIIKDENDTTISDCSFGLIENTTDYVLHVDAYQITVHQQASCEVALLSAYLPVAHAELFANNNNHTNDTNSTETHNTTETNNTIAFYLSHWNGTSVAHQVGVVQCGVNQDYTNMTEADADHFYSLFTISQRMQRAFATEETGCEWNSLLPDEKDGYYYPTLNTNENCTYAKFMESIAHVLNLTKHANATSENNHTQIFTNVHCRAVLVDRTETATESILCDNYVDVIHTFQLAGAAGDAPCGIVGAYHDQDQMWLTLEDSNCTVVELEGAITTVLSNIRNTCILDKFNGTSVLEIVPATYTQLAINLDPVEHEAVYESVHHALVSALWVAGAHCVARDVIPFNPPGTTLEAFAVALANSPARNCTMEAFEKVVEKLNEDVLPALVVGNGTTVVPHLTLIRWANVAVWPEGPYPYEAKCNGGDQLPFILPQAAALMSTSCAFVNAEVLPNGKLTFLTNPYTNTTCGEEDFVAEFTAAFEQVYANTNILCTLTAVNGESLVKTQPAEIKLSLATAPAVAAVDTQAITTVPQLIIDILDQLVAANNVAGPEQVCVLDGYEVNMEKSIDMEVYYVDAHIVENKNCTRKALEQQVAAWVEDAPLVQAEVSEYKAGNGATTASTISAMVALIIAIVTMVMA